MFPLLKREGLVLQYIALMALHILAAFPAVYTSLRQRSSMAIAVCPLATRALARSTFDDLHHFIMFVQVGVSLAGAGFLHACDALITPPARLPDLFTLLITAYSCAHFIGAYLASALPTPSPASKDKAS